MNVPMSSSRISLARRLIVLLLALVAPWAVVAGEDTTAYVEAPRVVAALEQGYAAEHGVGLRANPRLAIELYCAAGTMGSSEGFFRVGRLLAKGPARVRNLPLANAYLALAARLGHREAAMLHDPSVPNGRVDEICADIDAQAGLVRFDLDGYIAGLSPIKRKIAALIRRKAPQYGVDTQMALGIALAESNLDAAAVSPKNAQGVMQLIPETQERFGVQKPFDAEQNIKGGLAYLKWLHRRFDGDPMLIAAAYNAGEGAVEKYGDVPPFPETQQYVRRVLEFSGLGARTRVVIRR